MKPHRTDVRAAAQQADDASESFARQGMADERAISRCMASHYRQELDEKESHRA